MDTTTAPTKSPEQIIIELRQRVTSGGPPLTREEVRSALAALRQNRLAAAESSSKKKSPAQPARSATELLSALKNQTT